MVTCTLGNRISNQFNVTQEICGGTSVLLFIAWPYMSCLVD